MDFIMAPVNCCIALIVAGIAGTVAGQLLRGRGYGPVVDVVLGLVGGFAGTVFFRIIGANPGDNILSDLIVATIGAMLFVAVVRIFFSGEFGK